MNRIYLPAKSAEQWSTLLASPTKHWRTGYSARSLAYCWQEANGFPREVRAALSTSELLADCELLLAMPEHQVPLPGGDRPSQSDLWVLARAHESLVSIAVEGKVAESFGPTVGEWLANPSSGKLERLRFLEHTLGLSEPAPRGIRYQLLHRTASALIEARRFGAGHGLLLVHSFSQRNQWFEDFHAFAALFRATTQIGTVASVGDRAGVHLHLCWVCGNEDYLAR